MSDLQVITPNDLGPEFTIREKKLRMDIQQAIAETPMKEFIFPRPGITIASMMTENERRKLSLQGKFGILHLDFTAKLRAAERRATHWPIPNGLPMPTTLIETQTHDGGTVWIKPGERFIQFQSLNANTRYVVDLVGFWEI